MIFGKKSLTEKKRDNQILARDNFRAGEVKVSHYPLVIYIEPTSVCNLSCPMCPVAMGLPEYQYSEKFIEMNVIEALDEPLQYAIRCFMSGGGEPFLHPYFISLLEVVRGYDAEVIFNTNGTLITKEIALHLVKMSIHTISFSIDGISADKYRNIRKGAELEQVIEGILLIQEEKRNLGVERPYLNMQFTLMKDNIDELMGTVQFAYSLGLNHLVIEPLSPVFSFDSVYQDFFKRHYVEVEAELVQSLLKLKEQARARIFFSSHYLEEKEVPKRCAQPWINFGVRTDGRVFLCCGTSERMGSLKEEDFQSIWNGALYQGVRAQIGSGRYPEICRLCLEEARSPGFNSDLMLVE